MTDIDTLRTLRRIVGDPGVADVVAGNEALAVLGDRQRDRDLPPVTVPPAASATVGGKVLDPHGNPGVSVDAALALAEHACPREWPGIIHSAWSAQVSRHHWHTNFPRPGQREMFARAVLLALVDHLVAKADDTPLG